jgi:hypothetical protein
MIVQSGPADGPYDYRSAILAEIRGIARRHVVLNLPDADYSPSDIAQWKAWLEKYKGQHLSRPVFESVSDPYLQCLARRVEWGHRDAILDIATFGGPSAEPILKQFPTPKSGELMGAREIYSRTYLGMSRMDVRTQTGRFREIFRPPYCVSETREQRSKSHPS